MNRHALLIASVLALPSIATSQRGGSGATRKTELFDKNEVRGPSIRVRDVEDLSSVRLLIDKRKDLKLTDAQLAQLKDSEGKLKDKTAPTLKIIDSLIHELMVTRSNNSDEERSRVRVTQANLINAITEVRASYDEAAKETMTTFDADQKAKATEFMAEQKNEGDKILRQKMSGGRGGSGSE